MVYVILLIEAAISSGSKTRFQSSRISMGLPNWMALLQASDMRALELFDGLRENLGAADPAGLTALQASIGALDFDRAAEVCRQLLAEVSS